MVMLNHRAFVRWMWGVGSSEDVVHLVYGAHSGIPACCVAAWVLRGRRGGAVPVGYPRRWNYVPCEACFTQDAPPSAAFHVCEEKGCDMMPLKRLVKRYATVESLVARSRWFKRLGTEWRRVFAPAMNGGRLQA